MTALLDDHDELIPGMGEPAPRRRDGLRIAVVLALAVLVVVGLLGGAVLLSLTGNVDRVPGVFAGADEPARPPASEALTFLLVGTDTRSDTPTTGEAAGGGVGRDRSDVLMIARLDPSRTSGSVVSIPRDSWVDIPGHGMNKINAAYAFGGPPLLIRTVENLTGLRIDHFAVIDFAGFREMVDSVGGVDVRVVAPTSNDGVDFHQGLNHLDGTAALAFVRQRYGLPEGDLDRELRHEAALRALLAKAASSGMLADPAGLFHLLEAISRWVGVDDTLTDGRLVGLGMQTGGLRGSDVTFLRAPVAGLGREGPQSVVYLDPERARELWQALRDGRARDYAGLNPADSLGGATR